MFIRRLLFLTMGLLSLAQTIYANESGPGVDFTYPIIALEPENLHGYRVSLNYQPERLIGSYIKLYFDASYGRWWDHDTPTYKPTKRSTNIYSIAPVVRFFYKNNSAITPFLDISVGFSYLSNTRIYDRNLGMHFSFQDQLAIGASFGKDQHLSVSFGGIHYSNGALCDRNSGMTIPLFINVGYRF